MPPQTTKMGILNKLGEAGKKAFNEHKGDETKQDSGGRLPAGIENGIAQLVDCKFGEVAAGKKNAGKLFFYAAGVVKEPKKHMGVPIEGQRTTTTEPLYETPTRKTKTVSDHMAIVLNHLRLLGVPTGQLKDLGNLEAIVAELKKQKPHFKFRTWKGDKQTSGPYKDKEPLTNEVWSGTVEYSGSDEDAVEDETGEEVAEEASEEVEETEETEEETESAEESEDEVDLDALAKAADKEDEDAQNKIVDMCKEAGIDHEQFGSWNEAVAAIKEMSEGTDSEEVEEEDDWTPKVGKVYPYKSIGKKKAMDHEVVKINTKAKTVDLKNLDDDKVVKGISWEKIKPA